MLIVLVVYFAGRTTVEWYQCSEDSRGLRASLIDFRSAHVIGVFALGLYGVQKLLQVQVATEVSETGGVANPISIGLLIGLGLGTIFASATVYAGTWQGRVFVVFFVMVVAVWWFFLSPERPQVRWVAIGAGAGILPPSAIVLFPLFAAWREKKW